MSSSDSSFSKAVCQYIEPDKIVVGRERTLFLLFGLLLGGGSTTGSGSATRGSTASTARGNGGKLAGTLGDQL